MTNNKAWEEDSIKVNDADGNLKFEVIDLVKPDKLVPTYVKGAEYSDWRKDLGENWTNVTTGNKVGQTFRHISGTTVSTSGAMGGVESIPLTISIDGETVSAPDITQHNLQGYAKPMGSEILRKKKKEKVNPKLNASEKVAKKANADELMKARVNTMGPLGPIPKVSLPPPPRIDKGKMTVEAMEKEMKKWVKEYGDAKWKVEQRNIEIRNRNSQKVTKWLKGNKLTNTFTLGQILKDNGTSIKNGGIGYKWDGSKLTVVVQTGPDWKAEKGKGVFVNKGESLEVWEKDEITIDMDEGVQELPKMPDEVRDYLAGNITVYDEKGKPKLWNPIDVSRKNSLSRKVAHLLADNPVKFAGSAIRLLDHYMDEHVKKGAKYDPNLKNKVHDANKIFQPQTKEVLRNAVNYQKNIIDWEIKQAKEKIAKSPQNKELIWKYARSRVTNLVNDNLKYDKSMKQGSFDIHNSLGNQVGFDFDHYVKTGQYQFTSTYVFTSIYDFGSRGSGKISGMIGQIGSKYAAAHLHGDMGEAINNPMKFRVNIDPNKQYTSGPGGVIGPLPTKPPKKAPIEPADEPPEGRSDALSLNTPIVKRKKKSNWRSELNGN